MKIKNISKVVLLGLFVGLIYGLVKSILLISSQAYLQHGMYNLVFLEFTRNINTGVLSALVLSLLLTLLALLTSFIWRKLFSPFLEVKISKKKKLTPLMKGFSFGFLLVYWFIHLLRFLISPDYDARVLLGQSLIVFCLFFLILRFEKINTRRVLSKISGFSQSGGMALTAVIILSILMVMNMVNLGQKLLSPRSKPNILLIVADALRPDHLGCYGYDRPTSPRIDEFASNALLFEKAMSNSPWTKPSMGSLFTSFYPHEHQAFYWTDSLPDKSLTLAEVFKNSNYATIAVQTNPAITEKHNFRQGFQYYEEIVLGKGESVTSHFNTWVKTHKKRPFFAYLHFMDTHVPFNAPLEFSQIFGLKDNTVFTPGGFQTIDVRVLGEIGLSEQDRLNIMSLYDGAVKYFDNNFGEILDNLKKLELLKNTIVILTADHGEEFWEHKGFAHGRTLYNEVLQVPLIIKYSPISSSKRIEHFVQLLDIFPSILDMANIPFDSRIRGKNIVSPSLKNKEARGEIFFEGVLYGAEKNGVLKDGWKLIRNTGFKHDDTFHPIGDLMKYRYPEYKKGFELYNTNKDPQEQFNLIANYPEITTRLKASLRLFKIASPELAIRKRTNLENKLKDLKSLGYIK